MFTNKENAYFEKIWIEENVKHDYSIIKTLNDDEYINYHIWADINWREMYEKHLPNTLVVRGKNDILVFHGGCLSCRSQIQHGVQRCTGCLYFKFEHNKPDLSITKQ